MAGIIGNITRENRERKRGIEIMIQKSIYNLEPFDKRFDPRVSTNNVLLKVKLISYIIS